FDAGLLPSARRAGGDGALRQSAEKVWDLLCQLRVAQEWMVRRASQLEGCIKKALPMARRTEQVARRADAKSIY
ncbi:hypothetical protein A2U01_0093850, partial [Trifolium medium]|nr:hypothetical protein [Trifolium medium]